MPIIRRLILEIIGKQLTEDYILCSVETLFKLILEQSRTHICGLWRQSHHTCSHLTHSHKFKCSVIFASSTFHYYCYFFLLYLLFFHLRELKKTWNFLASLAISRALTIYPTNFLRPLFNSKFFLSFNFYFGHNARLGLKTWDN